jgi:hypothetical protein
MKYTAFLQFERKVFKQSQRNWPSYSCHFLIFNTLNLYGIMLKLLLFVLMIHLTDCRFLKFCQ